MTLLNFFPWRAGQILRISRYAPRDSRAGAENNFGRSRLIRGEEHPDYQSAWIYNPINFQDDAPIYARDTDAKTRERLLNAHRSSGLDRRRSDARGQKLQVVQGPIEARITKSQS
jgi:hypothetical protein